MIEGRPSTTAAFVAVWRALGDCLPPALRLCRDPLAWRFAPSPVDRLRPLAERFPAATGRVLLASPLGRLLLWIQLRTRAIDDLVIDYARSGGRQLVILGAGFDTRAVRLADRLEGALVLEVDHPATGARKRAVLEAAGQASAGARTLAWDFERDPIDALPAALVAQGLDPARPTFTIWEGVIPYLTERAVEATLGAVRACGGPGSRVLLHYIARSRIERRTIWHLLAARAGEPLRFGWDPSALPAWLAARGFRLERDRSDVELAHELFPVGTIVNLDGAGGRIAVAAAL